MWRLYSLSFLSRNILRICKEGDKEREREGGGGGISPSCMRDGIVLDWQSISNLKMNTKTVLNGQVANT